MFAFGTKARRCLSTRRVRWPMLSFSLFSSPHRSSSLVFKLRCSSARERRIPREGLGLRHPARLSTAWQSRCTLRTSRISRFALSAERIKSYALDKATVLSAAYQRIKNFTADYQRHRGEFESLGERCISGKFLSGVSLTTVCYRA